MPVPEVDKSAVARMQYEKDHRVKPGLISRETLFLKRGPDMSTAARSGDPAMTTLRPSVPPLVPQPAGAGNGVSGDVTATTVGDSTALDTKPDARADPPAAAGASTTPAAGQTTDSSQQTTTDPTAKKKKKSKKQQQQDQQNAAQPAAAQTPAAPPAAGTTPPSN